MKDNKEIDFIAKHYRKGRFDADKALRRIKPVRRFRWTAARTVAASALIAVVGATAAIIYNTGYFTTSSESIEQTQSVIVAPETIVRVIDFENAPLPVVVEKIKEVYGVEVIGLPANAKAYKLSLHYEGTAIDLLDTINDILDTDMQISDYSD